MVLGMEIGLSPGDFVLDGDPGLFRKRGHRAPVPNFRPISIVAKRLDASRCHGMEVGLSPWDFVLDGDPARPLNFRPMFIIVIAILLEHCSRYWFVQVQVLVLVLFAFFF